jgi:phosphoribosylamine--glycine ligase
MGAYAPVSIDTPALRDAARTRIFEPTLAALREAGIPFTGLLYAGLMVTADGPKVVEFNCRFGDPETQALLPLMNSSLLELMLVVARGESLANVPEPTWHSGASVTTVVAAPGYPNSAETGAPITFPAAEPDIYVFHAGTKMDGTTTVTAGGRVLAVTAAANTLADAAEASRSYAERIEFPGKQMRHDIGWRELERVARLRSTDARDADLRGTEPRDAKSHGADARGVGVS